MKCPKCGYTRTANDSIVPDWQCPKCGIVYAKFRSGGQKHIRVTLSSGTELILNEIRFFDAQLIAEFTGLNLTLSKNLKGFSTGIGFIGSLDYVLEASLVKGVIEAIVSDAMASTARKQVEEARDLLRKIRRTSCFEPISSVDNVEVPQPDSWRVPHFKSSSGRELIQLQSPYITGKVEGKLTDIFWDKVETYHIAG